MSSSPRPDRWTHRRTWGPLPGDDRRGKIDWICVNLYLLSIAIIDEYKTFVRSYTFLTKIFVGTKIFSPFTPASRGSIDRRWSPLGGGGPATSRVILARYGADRGDTGTGYFYLSTVAQTSTNVLSEGVSLLDLTILPVSMLLGTARSARG